MSTCWRPLRLNSAHDHLPPLLISCTFSQSSYTVHVTDLTNVWSESLEKRAIERRSEDEETSINPVNDTEQLRILLGKLQDGLTGNSQTSLSLSSRKGRNRSEATDLVLNIIATLPKPLKPLKWPVQLQNMGQSALTAHLTVPLIKAQNSRLKELELLIDLLKHKDHVIQRLVDKLETTGSDLASVFAGAASKNGKALPRNQAEERVKGLKPFDVNLWRKSAKLGEISSGSDPVRQILEEVFDEGSGLALGGELASEEPAEWENWWQNLGEVALELPKSPHVIRSVKRDLKADVESEDYDDDFQVQATPPPHDEGHSRESKNKTPTKKATPAKARDTSTEDDDDLDAPSQRSNAAIPDSLPLSQPTHQARRFGRIGGTKTKEPPKLPVKSTPESPVEPTKNDPLSGDETASEDDNAPLQPKVILLQSKATSSAVKSSTGGLGKIGGKRREPNPLPAVDFDDPSILEDSTSALTSPKHAKNSTIPKHESTEEEKNIDHETRGQYSAAKKDDSPESEESEMEKADRKREEKRRELEQKAKAPPKKKRRF